MNFISQNTNLFFLDISTSQRSPAKVVPNPSSSLPATSASLGTTSFNLFDISLPAPRLARDNISRSKAGSFHVGPSEFSPEPTSSTESATEQPVRVNKLPIRVRKSKTPVSSSADNTPTRKEESSTGASTNEPGITDGTPRRRYVTSSNVNSKASGEELSKGTSEGGNLTPKSAKSNHRVEIDSSKNPVAGKSVNMATKRSIEDEITDAKRPKLDHASSNRAYSQQLKASDTASPIVSMRTSSQPVELSSVNETSKSGLSDSVKSRSSPVGTEKDKRHAHASTSSAHDITAADGELFTTPVSQSSEVHYSGVASTLSPAAAGSSVPAGSSATETVPAQVIFNIIEKSIQPNNHTADEAMPIDENESAAKDGSRKNHERLNRIADEESAKAGFNASKETLESTPQELDCPENASSQVTEMPTSSQGSAHSISTLRTGMGTLREVEKDSSSGVKDMSTGIVREEPPAVPEDHTLVSTPGADKPVNSSSDVGAISSSSSPALKDQTPSSVILELLKEKARISNEQSLRALEAHEKLELEDLKCQRELEDLSILQQRELEDSKRRQRRHLEDLKQKHAIRVEKLKVEAKRKEACMNMDIQVKYVEAMLQARPTPDTLSADKLEEIVKMASRLFES